MVKVSFSSCESATFDGRKWHFGVAVEAEWKNERGIFLTFSDKVNRMDAFLYSVCLPVIATHLTRCWSTSVKTIRYWKSKERLRMRFS